MKKTKDPFIKIRIILASIFLTIILGGWIIYGYTFIKTNPAKILTKLSNIEKQNINNNIDNIDFKSEKNSKDNITTTTVREISGTERLNEIARIISGAEITPESLATAKTLMK